MWRSKKFIFTVLLTVVVLGGILGGYAVAKANDEDNTPPPPGNANFLEKVAEFYEQRTGVAINPDELQNAFNDAREELGNQARESFRERLLEEGKVTQEQLDEFDKWMSERPDAFSEEFKDWLESRPDIGLPFGLHNEDGERSFGKMFRHFRGFNGGPDGGFGGWCDPDASEE
jgi:hypothetical protein